MTSIQKIDTKYATEVMDHFNNPRNIGSFDDGKNIGTGVVGAPACGDVLKFQIKVDDNGEIVDAKFKAFGCGSAIASSSLATELVKGKSIEDSLRISNDQIAQKLSLPPIKLHCSMLAEDAIKSAIKNYKSKNSLI
ncbi:iron sulfur cluster assembly protein 1 [Vittaforma corneae ATCC 50505]|uniref:Iron sulfur cluster assembly protein 1 n=1 Tax=Vittaforma corneae (strain ATCC 50505) TaxID=993615 RepID=L2GLI5_VITCO|nr:iron sulfur cluster assembly protein 1 [Vittaforma corneae ATCC 50505]ELA41748.1 iron sulfur cluster assembly protein 1 [Vittaforma corneae ATCC 50505]